MFHIVLQEEGTLSGPQYRLGLIRIEGGEGRIRWIKWTCGRSVVFLISGRMHGLRGLVVGPGMFLILAGRSYRQTNTPPSKTWELHHRVGRRILAHWLFKRNYDDYVLTHFAPVENVWPTCPNVRPRSAGHPIRSHSDLRISTWQRKWACLNAFVFPISGRMPGLRGLVVGPVILLAFQRRNYRRTENTW